MTQLIEGTVVENHGAIFDVLLDGQLVRCILRGKLKKDKRRKTAPVAAGDRVSISLLERGRGVIEHVFPRTSGLSRTAAGGEPLQQTLAANIDQAVIVFAMADPRPDFSMLDRFLVVATAAGLGRVVCFNKCDLAPPEWLWQRIRVYERVADKLLCASALRGDGLAEVRELLRERRSVICGPSGVGKSSLLNAVAPGLSLRTGEVGEVTHKGRHTTSSITYLQLPFGGWVADTPGLRQLGFWEVSPDQVVAAFPDLQPYLGRCRFSNCSHGEEEGCALRGAVQAGEVDSQRLRSFLGAGREVSLAC